MIYELLRCGIERDMLIWILAETLIDLYLFLSAAPIRVHHSAIICTEAQKTIYL